VEPTDRHCDWVEAAEPLKVGRWYSTNQLLPDGRQIIVGGRNTFTLEYAPPSSKTSAIYFPFLNQTADSKGPNNWYPFVHLLPHGELFIFANRDSIIYDYKLNKVVRTFDKIPGSARNYPSGGSSVMLPLGWENNWQKVYILVCGGATSVISQASCQTTCGRIEVTNGVANATWAMEVMPSPRCMGDMVLLPDTNVMIINGAKNGNYFPVYNFVLLALKEISF